MTECSDHGVLVQASVVLIKKYIYKTRDFPWHHQTNPFMAVRTE